MFNVYLPPYSHSHTWYLLPLFASYAIVLSNLTHTVNSFVFFFLNTCSRVISVGIKGLTKLIRDNCPGAIKETSLKGYTGMKICIDASNALYQFMVAIRSMGSNGSAAAQVRHTKCCPSFFFMISLTPTPPTHPTYPTHPTPPTQPDSTRLPTLSVYTTLWLCIYTFTHIPNDHSSPTMPVKSLHTSLECLRVPFA